MNLSRVKLKVFSLAFKKGLPTKVMYLNDFMGSLFCNYGRIETGVPIGTIRANSSTSLLFMRIQPRDTALPMELGSLVP